MSSPRATSDTELIEEALDAIEYGNNLEKASEILKLMISTSDNDEGDAPRNLALERDVKLLLALQQAKEDEDTLSAQQIQLAKDVGLTEDELRTARAVFEGRSS